MKHAWHAALVGLAVLGMTACATAKEPDLTPDEDGYIHLFNGEDRAGWEMRNDRDDFNISDGVMRSVGRTGSELMLFTAREFGDFELVVEWRVSPGGNSGVFIRAPKEGWPWETAYEIQISNEQPPRDPIHCTGSLYGYAAVDPRPDETPEQWRTYVITAEGENITVRVDGEQVVDFDQSTTEATKDKPLKGYIGIQDSHAGEGSWVEYRTIKVKPLD